MRFSAETRRLIAVVLMDTISRSHRGHHVIFRLVPLLKLAIKSDQRYVLEEEDDDASLCSAYCLTTIGRLFQKFLVVFFFFLRALKPINFGNNFSRQ